MREPEHDAPDDALPEYDALSEEDRSALRAQQQERIAAQQQVADQLAGIPGAAQFADAVRRLTTAAAARRGPAGRVLPMIPVRRADLDFVLDVLRTVIRTLAQARTRVTELEDALRAARAQLDREVREMRARAERGDRLAAIQARTGIKFTEDGPTGILSVTIPSPGETAR